MSGTGADRPTEAPVGLPSAHDFRPLAP